ncbi:MAG: fasciclin domain-containing protein [Bacteroidales bacterium]
MKKISFLSILLILSSFIWIGCNDDDDKPDGPTSNILQLVEATPSLSTLKTAIDAADLESALSSNTASYTVFAPTNDAFAKLPEGALESLLSDPEGALQSILLYHVIEGVYSTEKLTNELNIKTLNGEYIQVTVGGGTIYVNDIELSVAPIYATNGVVYIIDTVLIPTIRHFNQTLMEIVEGSSVHTTLEAALKAAKLNTTLSSSEVSLTLFAPTDAAFALLPVGTVEALLEDPEGALKNILLYHVLGSKIICSEFTEGTVPTLLGIPLSVTIMDGVVYLDNAKITLKNVEGSNGVIHVIDAVLIPEGDTAK